MMNIIDFVKEFEFKNAEGLGVGGVRKYAQGGAAGPRRPP